MVSFRCYDNSDVIVTVIITNFHLYLIQRWWQSFQIFVNSDVVYAQARDVLTLKNSMESPKFPSPASHENSWPQWSAVYANLIKSRCTLGQILIMCLNYLLKNCIFYQKKFVGTLIYTIGQNQCHKINNGLLPALFWLTNIKHRIKLVIVQWSWHYWKRRKQFLWKSGDRVLIFTAGTDEHSMQQKRASKIEKLESGDLAWLIWCCLHRDGRKLQVISITK